MAAHIESVVVRDPEIHNGDPVFRGLVFRSRYFLTISKVEKLWMNFWNNIRA
jgi:hypothetical protein